MYDDITLRKFWSKVDKRGPDECWPWIGRRSVHGYGRIKVDGKDRTATHLSLEVHGYPRPKDLFALHSCDNPPCVNPSHLRWGTHRENTQDAVDRDRFHRWAGERKGDGNPKSKLTRDAANLIRAEAPLRRGRMKALAEEYGVSSCAISDIVHGRTWL